jgi:hypothetical protein
MFACERKDKGTAGKINGLFGTCWESRETSGETAGSTEKNKGLTWHCTIWMAPILLPKQITVVS